MKQTYFKTIAALLLLVTNTVFAIPLEEREALIKLYHATDGAQWNRSTNWLGEVGTECAWEGINCTDNGLNVIGLSLVSNNLQGHIPAEIGKLSRLEHFDLSQNRLSSLPAEIWQLSRLKSLSLRLTYLKLRTLTSEIGELSNLESLDLSGNKLTHLPSEIGQLSNLESLNLCVNKLTHLPSEIGQLSNLKSLCLSYNKLTRLPVEIGQLSNLESLFLGEEPNDFFYSSKQPLETNVLTYLPIEIAQLSSLKKLYLSNNRLTSLPDRFISQLSSQNIYVSLIGNCFDESASVLFSEAITKPNLGQQRADCDLSAAHFNEQTGLLTLTNVVAGGVDYHVGLQRLNESQFQLGTVFLLNSPNNENPAHYDFNTLLLDIPSVFAYGQNYRVQMKNDGTADNIFTITDVTVK